MVFNSVIFLVFLAVVLTAYYVLPFRWQNRMLLVASYVFYGWWDERFLFLIVLSTCVDFWAGLLIDRGKLTPRQRIEPSLALLLAAVAFLGMDWRAAPAAATPLALVADAAVGHTLNLTLGSQGRWGICLVVAASLVVVQLLIEAVTRLSETIRRRVVLAASILINLGVLGFFKYFNFFAESTADALRLLGLQAHPVTLNVILPVGISFYTFQTMSYGLDIFRRQMRATGSFLGFALFVSFFPQLVAGPIERAATLLPQVERPRRLHWESITNGLFLIALGLFSKVAIADGVAGSVDSVFNSAARPSWADVVCASVLFAIQIYGDFSGYSHVARGTAKLMGFELMLNFHVPYFSRSPREFWRRWHISLSTFLRDYLFFPLGGSRVGRAMAHRNTLITLLLSGLWHGAAWNFVLWGAFHGVILCVQRAIVDLRGAAGHSRPEHSQPAWRVALGISGFFAVICYSMMIFRARSVSQIVDYTSILLSQVGDLSLSMSRPALAALVGLPLLFLYDVGQFCTDDPDWHRRQPAALRGLLYASVVFVLLLGLSTQPAQFIYFQF